MKKEQKQEIIVSLKEKFQKYPNFYITETQSITVEGFSKIRRASFAKGIQVEMVKNSLLERSLKELDTTGDKYTEVLKNLKGVSVVFFSENPKAPASIISEFRKNNSSEKPKLKVVLIDGDVYVGDGQLEFLKQIKTKQELVADVVALLQSPIQSLLSALQSPSNKLAGALKAIEEKKQ